MRRFQLKFAVACLLAAASTVALAHGDQQRIEAKLGSATIVLAQAEEQPGHGAEADASAMTNAGDLELTGGWARAMLPGQPAGGAYVAITNLGSAPDRLVAASSPAAGKVEVHTMAVVNDVMTMRPVEGGLEIPAGGTVEMKPGGYHIMFLQVSQPFKAGGEVSLTLEFEKAGKVDVVLPVKAQGPAEGHSSHGG